MSDHADKFGLFLLGFAVAALSGLIIFGDCMDDFRTDAIEHGAAEWRFDSKTGGKKFHWLTEAREKAQQK